MQTGFVSVAGLCVVVVLVCLFVMSSGTWCVAYSSVCFWVYNTLLFILQVLLSSYFWSVFFHGFGF